MLDEADQSRLRGMALRLQWNIVWGELTQLAYLGAEQKLMANGLYASRFIRRPGGQMGISPQAHAFLCHCAGGNPNDIGGRTIIGARHAARALIESHSDRRRA